MKDYRSDEGRRIAMAINAHRAKRNLSVERLAVEWGVPKTTLNQWTKGMPPRLHRHRKLLAEKLPEVFEGDERWRGVDEDIELIRSILIFLHRQLDRFANGTKEMRDRFRSKIGPLTDLGYVSSLLTAMADEGVFERFKRFTTTQFSGLRKESK